MASNREISEIINATSRVYTGKDASYPEQQFYCGVLSRFSITDIKRALTDIAETHVYRNVPAPAVIINVIKSNTDNKRRKLGKKIPAFMVYKNEPISRYEIEEMLRTDRSIYDAITEWNSLTEEEQEARFCEIGLGKDQRDENMKRIQALTQSVYRYDPNDQKYAKVPCIVCGEQTTPITSVNDYMKYLNQKVDYEEEKYACRRCLKGMIS